MEALAQDLQGRSQVAGQYLSFSLGGEEYGVDILKVQEIKGWEPVRPLPDTPHYICGVMDLRGLVVPVIDLRRRFDLAEADYSPTTVIVILATVIDGRKVIAGLVVDSVSDVLEVAADTVAPPPDLGPRIDTGYIHGVVTRNGRMVVLLDADALLDPAALEGMD